jgi:hypothetical protein
MIHIEMRKILVICIMVIISAGCHKDKELLTGDIMGKIRVYNQDLTASSDNSGVQVSLYSDKTLLETTLSDTRGQYRFENISYGKYSIDLQKDKYIKAGANYTFNHIGGYSPSLFDGSVYEIPDYTLTIDSVKVKSSEGELLVYLKIDGNDAIPFSFYDLIGYCGNDPTVSKDNYSFIVTGIVANSFSLYPYTYYDADGVIYYMNRNISPDTIYIRFYLLTFGQSIYYSINKESLGKPSNVTSFIWQ